VHEYNKSTYLAVLGVLVSVATALTSFSISRPDKEDFQAAERCLQHACSIATCLKENSPQLIKSRQYTRWVLAEEVLHRKVAADDSLESYLHTFPGSSVWRGLILTYVPIRSENPMWRVSQERTENQSAAPLETTLQTARAGLSRDRSALHRGDNIPRSRGSRGAIRATVKSPKGHPG
jgi:hypothetical protein